MAFYCKVPGCNHGDRGTIFRGFNRATIVDHVQRAHLDKGESVRPTTLSDKALADLDEALRNGGIA